VVVSREPLKVGVVGLGYFAQLHLDAWQAIDEVELLAITDQDPEKVAAVAQERGVTGVSGLAELLAAQGALDILDLVVPPAAHESLILQALDKVPLIICQKPFCASLSIARNVAKTAQQSNSTLLVHENFRFQPWFRTLKHWLDAGSMGEVFQARFALRPGDGRGADAYLARQPGFQTMKRLLLHETGVHYMDVLPWLFGEVHSIYAQINKFNPVIAGEDAGMFILEHASGVRSVFDGNRLADHVAENTRLTMGEMVIEGEAGTVTLDGSGAGMLYKRFVAICHSKMMRCNILMYWSSVMPPIAQPNPGAD